MRRNRAVGLSLAVIAAMVAGCTTVGPNDIPDVPANYRQLIVDSYAEKGGLAKLRKAEISPPGVWESPLAPSAARPIACVRMTVDGSFGPHTYAVGYKFLNGKIEEAFNPEYNNPGAGGLLGAALRNAATCGKLEYKPFPELERLAKRQARS